IEHRPLQSELYLAVFEVCRDRAPSSLCIHECGVRIRKTEPVCCALKVQARLVRSAEFLAVHGHSPGEVTLALGARRDFPALLDAALPILQDFGNGAALDAQAPIVADFCDGLAEQVLLVAPLNRDRLERQRRALESLTGRPRSRLPRRT